MVNDLGVWARWQGFLTKEQAMHDYLQARVQGTVKIVQNANDTNDQFGPPKDAEDLPID